MNEIVIGIRYNDKVLMIGRQWPKLATLKVMARLEIARLKRNARDIVERVAMAIIPMPAMALA